MLIKHLLIFIISISQLPVADPFLEKVNLSDLGKFHLFMFFALRGLI